MPQYRMIVPQKCTDQMASAQFFDISQCRANDKSAKVPLKHPEILLARSYKVNPS